MKAQEIDELFSTPGLVDIELRNGINHHIAITLGYILKPVGEAGSRVRILRHWNMDPSRLKGLIDGGLTPLKSFLLRDSVTILPVVEFNGLAVGAESPKAEEKKVTENISGFLPPEPDIEEEEIKSDIEVIDEDFVKAMPPDLRDLTEPTESNPFESEGDILNVSANENKMVHPDKKKAKKSK